MSNVAKIADQELVLDPIVCDGHGLCADLLPELIALDDWGFPIVKGEAGADLQAHAKRAVAVCPVLALKLRRVSAAGRR